MDWSKRYANRIALQEPSKAVTEILKLAERPDIISFAGGLPDPQVFPVERIRESAERVLDQDGRAALNYGANPGFSRLREWIACRMAFQQEMPCALENVVVTSGGLEALHLVSLALLQPGSTVIVGAPTYLTALHVFRAQEAHIRSVRLDSHGMDPDHLRHQLRESHASGERVALLYLIPSFQNPMGVTLPAPRREAIVRVCREFGVPIVEDHAYAELWFEGGPQKSLWSYDPENVILIHTFSKIFGPGVRLGWAVAPPALAATLALCKLGTDQCANTLTQRIVLDAGERGWIDEQIESSRSLYRAKRDRLLAELQSRLPTMSFTRPQGGFYTWCEWPGKPDTEELLKHAVAKEKVAFVAGPPFFADGSGARFMRLSYSYVASDQIAEGVQRLANLLPPR